MLGPGTGILMALTFMIISFDFQKADNFHPHPHPHTKRSVICPAILSRALALLLALLLSCSLALFQSCSEHLCIFLRSDIMEMSALFFSPLQQQEMAVNEAV